MSTDQELDESAGTIMKLRNFKLLEFLSNEGKCYKSNYDKLTKAMKLPANAKFEGEIKESLRQCYENHRYSVIPAFFKTILYLKKQKREFSIVFRTHGRELSTIIEELNLFCDGRHPAFNGENGTHLVTFNGSKKSARDFRIKPHQTGMYFRFSRELSDVSLLINTLERHKCENTDQLIEHYGSQVEDNIIQLYNESMQENYAVMMDMLMKHGSMAIQDDFWPYHLNQHNDFGKLFVIDQSDFSTQHIFFDDLAVVGEKCNIDVRDLATSEKIPEKKWRNKYVVRANVYDAILEHDYFIKHIEKCEKARDEEILKIQEGIKSEADEADIQSENEWEKLQNMSNEDYLMHTISPLLYQGLNIIASERPQNPIEFLSLYMLQNQHLVKTVDKTA